ncbi:DsbA family protein [Ehrlichia ruminantium]|uniref:DsbA family protein n=1 Tax=Ehrlichia ruminantium TaxID=779 RepID=A0AAE6UKZ4_EHRRU|nr:DsbA family protein [Ehrlichia ruminantium]QGR02809.1 DsbA family protein [Ehrlichia ruminantium]QGR03733.1 DsbA family protein [Ehrlichia ruminantium]QGR04660.1 DsbA family protein [Ehrlichia ruminantium]
MRLLVIGKLFCILIAVFYCGAAFCDGVNVQESQHKFYSDTLVKISDDISPKELLTLLPNDRFLGNTKAPVVMIEYASFSCMHCAHFALNIFPVLESKYIKEGKLLYIFRNFPLDYVSLKAAMLGTCYDTASSFFTYNKAVFSSIEALVTNYRDLGVLSNIAKISNISEERFNKCVNDEDIMNYIIQEKFVASRKLQVNATPVFFINGKKYDKAHDVESFSETINELIMLHPNYSLSNGNPHDDVH